MTGANMAKELFEVWVYHPKELAKVVKSDEAKALYKDGWFDSPAKCVEKPLSMKKK